MLIKVEPSPTKKSPNYYQLFPKVQKFFRTFSLSFIDTITKEDAIRIIDKMDINKDGSIEWSEFLQAMYEWLESIGGLKDGTFGDESNPVNV